MKNTTDWRVDAESRINVLSVQKSQKNGRGSTSSPNLKVGVFVTLRAPEVINIANSYLYIYNSITVILIFSKYTPHINQY